MLYREHNLHADRHPIDMQLPPSRTSRTFLMGIFCGACLTGVALRSLPDDDIAFYTAARDIIEAEFVRPVSREELLASAVAGVTESLDPYSRFYVNDDLQRIREDTRGTFEGIGAVFASPMDAGRILFPIPGSPAERSGIRVGDQILDFNGQPISEFERGELTRMLMALPGSTISLEVRHLDGQVEQLQITPGEVNDPTVRHLTRLTPEVGYLAIASFSRRTADEFDAAVARLRSAGAQSLILDLRGNPGGVLSSATQIANRFIDSGTLLITESRHGKSKTLADPAEAHLLNTPLVVLVDGQSASASEVLAGALQDNRRAALVGTATWGKGAIQSLIPLTRPDSILKITTGFYATPSGRSIDRHYREDGGSAIWPDFEVALEQKERAELHEHLMRYSAPFELIEQVAALESQLDHASVPRVAIDSQLTAALSLLTPKGL